MLKRIVYLLVFFSISFIEKSSRNYTLSPEVRSAKEHKISGLASRKREWQIRLRLGNTYGKAFEAQLELEATLEEKHSGTKLNARSTSESHYSVEETSSKVTPKHFDRVAKKSELENNRV